jgi:hypothetical protein
MHTNFQKSERDEKHATVKLKAVKLILRETVCFKTLKPCNSRMFEN